MPQSMVETRRCGWCGWSGCCGCGWSQLSVHSSSAPNVDHNEMAPSDQDSARQQPSGLHLPTMEKKRPSPKVQTVKMWKNRHLSKWTGPGQPVKSRLLSCKRCDRTSPPVVSSTLNTSVCEFWRPKAISRYLPVRRRQTSTNEPKTNHQVPGPRTYDRGLL